MDTWGRAYSGTQRTGRLFVYVRYITRPKLIFYGNGSYIDAHPEEATRQIRSYEVDDRRGQRRACTFVEESFVPDQIEGPRS